MPCRLVGHRFGSAVGNVTDATMRITVQFREECERNNASSNPADHEDEVAIQAERKIDRLPERAMSVGG